MTIDVLMSKIFDFSKPTYFRWKKEARPIITLISTYFTKEDLEEFLKTGKILRFELLPNIDQIQENISKKFKQKFKKFLVKYDSIDCECKITGIIYKMQHEKIELSQINILTFINDNKDYSVSKLSNLEKIAFAAAISDLSEFELQVAIKNDFTLV